MARRLRLRWSVAPLALLVVAACTDRADGGTGTDDTWPDDRWEVWICRVHPQATDPIYAGLPLRLALTPAGVTTAVGGVSSYFDRLSNGRYRPVFRPGGEVTMEAGDGPNECVERALDGSLPTTRGVLAVADAEHGDTQHGGFGRAGNACTQSPCPASVSRRAAYVGGADFHPDWGGRPPLDLVEHEIGHALGWGHSGLDGAGGYTSALDVMSDSAAPRTVRPERRDAPGTLALNRVRAGWIPAADVVTVPPGGSTVALQPSGGPSGARLAMVPLAGDEMLTVELRSAEGLDDHLPADGISVHHVHASDPQRPAVALVGDAPYTTLLRPGDALVASGWRIEVAGVDDSGWTVRLVPEP